MILQIDYSVITARVPPLGIHRKLLFMKHGEPAYSDGHTITLSQKGKEDVLNAAMFLKRNLVTTPTMFFYSDSQSSILSANNDLLLF